MIIPDSSSSFAIDLDINFQVSSQSVPCRSVLISKTNEASRKRSAVSEGSAGSRKVSFVFEDAHSSNGVVSKTSRVDPSPDLEKALQVQLELARQAGEMDDFISSSNNLNNEGVKSSPPMIQLLSCRDVITHTKMGINQFINCCTRIIQLFLSNQNCI